MRKTYSSAIHLLLYDQSSLPSRNKRFKHLFKVTRDLLERPFNSLVFPLIERFNEFLYTLRRSVQLASPSEKLVSLLGEVIVLFKRLLVDVSELLQSFVDLVQAFDKLSSVSFNCKTHLIRSRFGVLAKGVFGKDTQISNSVRAFLLPRSQSLPLRQVPLGIL